MRWQKRASVAVKSTASVTAGTQSPSAACVCMAVGHEHQAILVYRVLAVGLVRICQHSLLLRSARYLVRQMKTPQEIAMDINTKLMTRSCGGDVRLAETGPVFDGRQALLPWGSAKKNNKKKTLRSNHKWHGGPMNADVNMLIRQERLTHHRMALADDHLIWDEIQHCAKCHVTRAIFCVQGSGKSPVYVDDNCNAIASKRPVCVGGGQ